MFIMMTRMKGLLQYCVHTGLLKNGGKSILAACFWERSGNSFGFFGVYPS